MNQWALTITSCWLRNSGEVVEIMIAPEAGLRVESSVHPVVEKLHHTGVEEKRIEKALDIPQGKVAEPRKPRVCNGYEHQLEHNVIVPRINQPHIAKHTRHDSQH